MYRQVLAGRERVLGDAHPVTLATRIAVAQMLEEQGRYQAAEQLYREVFEVSQRVLGEAHPHPQPGADWPTGHLAQAPSRGVSRESSQVAKVSAPTTAIAQD